MARLFLRGFFILIIILFSLIPAILSGCSDWILPTSHSTTRQSEQTQSTATATQTVPSTGSTQETTKTTGTTAFPEISPTEMPVTPTQSSISPSGEHVTYTVKAGDTLFSISRIFQITVQQIVAANHITDPDQIYVGQILQIPTENTDPTPQDFSDLDNKSFGWWYQVPSILDQDHPATVPDEISTLLAKYEAIWQLNDNDRNVVYLTMDAGYEYDNNTSKILDIAAEKQVKISFFVTGSFIAGNPDTVLRMVRERHQVCNHTEKHLNQPEALDISLDKLINDIAGAENRFAKLTGKSFAPFLRPPEGVYSERSLAVIQSMGYRAVFWSFAYADWQTDAQPDPVKAYNKIMSQLHPGSILLLHTVSTTNVQILDRLVDGIRERGYTIELLPTYSG